MMREDQIKQKLAADFPELKIGKAVIIGQGWHHTAVEVNETIVFRLPRGVHERPVDGIGYETAVLKHLGGTLPVAIPDPLYIAPDNSYYGYPKLPGDILIDAYPSFSDDEKDQLVRDWVDTAAAIHEGVSVEMARALGVPKFDGADADLAAEARQILDIEGLDLDVMQFAQLTIEAASTIKMEESISFIHNDLQFQNFLIDPDTRRITGLFDWTDICIGPLAREFSLSEWVRDVAQLERAVQLYQKKTSISVDPRQAQTLKHLEEVSDLVEHMRVGDHEETEQSLETIRYLISQGVFGD